MRLQKPVREEPTPHGDPFQSLRIGTLLRNLTAKAPPEGEIRVLPALWIALTNRTIPVCRSAPCSRCFLLTSTSTYWAGTRNIRDGTSGTRALPAVVPPRIGCHVPRPLPRTRFLDTLGRMIVNTCGYVSRLSNSVPQVRVSRANPAVGREASHRLPESAEAPTDKAHLMLLLRLSQDARPVLLADIWCVFVLRFLCPYAH